ncbi:1-phosphofructokinase family hexose kinase [Zhihengliuella sp. ISTPL4]|uniref:1-phosphofructokinase family hexose kinase n=1 Tax=Zhihengliuella sp. ISTPL4 TaxID=2058657 RepID=UPI000C7959F6|nr:hexose kinase [Zhihengliuella sp. ISTPL4]
MTHQTPPTPAWWPAPSDLPLMVVGPNPAMDRLQVIGQLEPGAVHRVRTVAARAGGKSFIVARSIRALGPHVELFGFLGGAAGQLARKECTELGMGDRHTPIAADTRITPVVVEAKTGRSTVFNEPGPPLTADEQAAFRAAVDDALVAGRVVVCTGSLPPDLEPDTYARIVGVANERGAYAAVDASGTVLRETLAAHPWLVKCNRHEFEGVLKEDAEHDDAAIRERMRALVADGVGIVIVTMGARSFLVATADGVWSVTVPTVPTVNATGSGDTFLAAFIASVKLGATFADALAAAAAGGAFNAARLEPGLIPGAELAPLAEQIGFTRIDGASAARATAEVRSA